MPVINYVLHDGHHLFFSKFCLYICAQSIIKCDKITLLFMKWSVKVVFLSSFFLFIGLQVSAQSKTRKDSLVSFKIAELHAVWNLDNPLAKTNFSYESFDAIPKIFKITTKESVSDKEYVKKVNEARIKLLKQDIGLEAVGSYLHNFDPGFNSEDNLLYQYRVQAGLDWNVLGDGFFEHRYKQQILKNENEILSLTPETKKTDGENYVAISHKIIYSFNIHKIKILEKRQQIIDDKISVANELYLLKDLSRLNMLEIMQQQVDVGSMTRIYKSYNDELKLKMNVDSIPTNVLPVFDVDMSKYLSVDSASQSAKLNEDILKLKIENLKLTHKPLTDIKVNTQVRYNYYDLISNTQANRSFISAGIGVAVPIPLSFKANKNLINAQTKLIEFNQRDSQNAQKMDLINSFYEFRYKLKQYSNFYEKRKKYEELIRIESVKEKFKDMEFNPLTALNLLDEMLSVDVELLDIQQQMYLQLLDIHSKAPTTDIAKMIKPYKMDTLSMASEKANRSIYIWSEAQNKYEPSYIAEYLRLNKVSTAILSLKKDQSNKTQAVSLIGKLNSKGIKVELLIGNNNILNSDNPVMVIESITSGLDLKTLSAIHLDVEPQAMKDWAANKEDYLKKYVDLLKATKTYCSQNNLQLSVSIPVFFPEETLKEIYGQADHVYVMAYEHKDSDYIVRKVKEEMEIDPLKTVIALRAKDFTDRNEYEKLVSELGQLLSTTNFAMHDFETFVKLDEISVNHNQK